ncbi:DUF2157 domain-containing protein [Aliiglaciecola litoralis]|uniref:DUF2157 domain-containing protein n=1 Tax=Aliiglaciecola litoralis TaxID=582857 RepID=A0ABP3WQ83_9ALTE
MLNPQSTAARQTLADLIEQQHLKESDVPNAINLAELSPRPSQWHSFIHTLLFWSGILGLTFAVIFFVAANWQELGRFAKFGLVEGLIALSVIGFCKYDTNQTIRNGCLLVAMLSVGALMALFGQTYQTGADPWQLFFNWAVLTLPWVLVSRFNVMWLLWLGLLNLSVSLFYDAFGGFLDHSYAIFVLNSLALAVWQFSASRFEWLNTPWAINLIGFASGFFAMWVFFIGLFDEQFIGIALWVIWAIAIFYVYRYRTLNVFMLSGLCLSLIIAANSLLIKTLPSSYDGFFFVVLCALTIGAGTYATLWLKSLLEKDLP